MSGTAVSSHLFGNEDQLSRILCSIRAPVVITVKLFYLKSTAGQQMLGFESEQMPHWKGLDVTFFAAVRVGDVVDQLNVADLVERIPGDHLVATHDTAPIGRCEGRLLGKLLAQIVANQRIEGRVEDIQNQPAVLRQVPPNGR